MMLEFCISTLVVAMKPRSGHEPINLRQVGAVLPVDLGDGMGSDWTTALPISLRCAYFRFREADLAVTVFPESGFPTQDRVGLGFFN